MDREAAVAAGRQALLGFVAGLVGSVAMSVVIRTMGRGIGGGRAAQFNAAADAQRWQETLDPTDPRPPTEVAAEAAHIEVMGHPPTPETRARLGTVAHLALGGALGSIYALVPRHSHGPDVVGGLTFGSVVWIVADEMMIPLLGLGGGPAEQGASEHGLALAAHLAYGGATSATLAGLRALDRRG